MKKGIKLIATALIASSMIITACKKKDQAVYVDDINLTMDENPADGESIANLDATSEIGTLAYALTSEFPAGAIKLDSVSGTLTVRDAYLFNFEINPSITATIDVSNGTNTEAVDVTVTLSDVDEIPAVIGDYRDGGVVFWVNPLDIHQGMVCTMNDVAASSAEWGCWDLFDPLQIDGAYGTAIGTGAQNTIDIEAECATDGTAADICATLSLEGYSDWFLPSRDEMLAIYENKTAINATSVSNGGNEFSESVVYWTSSQVSASNAYDFYFLNGQYLSVVKINLFSVRAARAF
jgi:hypothetical protein